MLAELLFRLVGTILFPPKPRKRKLARKPTGKRKMVLR